MAKKSRADGRKTCKVCGKGPVGTNLTLVRLDICWTCYGNPTIRKARQSEVALQEKAVIQAEVKRAEKLVEKGPVGDDFKKLAESMDELIGICNELVRGSHEMFDSSGKLLERSRVHVDNVRRRINMADAAFKTAEARLREADAEARRTVKLTKDTLIKIRTLHGELPSLRNEDFTFSEKAKKGGK